MRPRGRASNRGARRRVLATQVAATDVNGHSPLHSVGGSFRDMTRVAGANPAIWIDIFLDNRDAILSAVEDAQAQLGTVADALRSAELRRLVRLVDSAPDGEAVRCGVLVAQTCSRSAR